MKSSKGSFVPALIPVLFACGCSKDPAIGQWNGHVDGLTFRSGADAVKLVIDDGGSGIVGKVLFGNGVLAPATDPNAGYPIEESTAAPFDIQEPFEGFPYTMIDPKVDGDQVTFGFDVNELWGRWCSLQTSFPSAGGFGCAPNDGSSSTPMGCFTGPPGMMTPIDCTKLDLCNFRSVCRCDANGCGPQTPSPSSRFDVAVDGDQMKGSAKIIGTFNVTLTRAD